MKRTKPAPALSQLQESIGYRFADEGLLRQALTHVGAAPSRVGSYQRLEFLGDRVLGVNVAAMLMATFPGAEEGELSRRLAGLVRSETCAIVAEAWMVEPYIQVAPGERASLRRSVLGDVCEAVIGAVYLDGGATAAALLVERAFAGHMREPTRPLRDAKTALQEWAQAAGHGAPIYRECSRSGPDHAPIFIVAVAVSGHDEAEASGASKRAAEQAAAARFMTREGIGEGTPT